MALGWWLPLFPLFLLPIVTQADASAVAEELNVAWAAHEITADFMRQTLAWIDSKGHAVEGKSSLVAEL